MSKLGNLRFLAANTFADAWNKAEAGYAYFIDITGNTDSPTTTANRWFGQMWKNDTGKYGWQVVWSFNGTIYKRERNNSDVWTDWNTYALKSDLYPSYDQITLFSDVKADVTNKSITITENGMVQAAAKTQAIEGAAFIRLIINGAAVYEGHTVSGKYRYLWTPIFPVKKGDIIKVTLETGTSDGQRFVYFYKS